MIKAGDIVDIHIHSAGLTMSRGAKVLHVPCATGDGWVFDDHGCIVHMTEGCTVTMVPQKESNEG